MLKVALLKGKKLKQVKCVSTDECKCDLSMQGNII